MQAVNVPGVGTLQFPDGMSQPDMASAIQKNFPQIHGQQAAPDAPPSNSAADWALGAGQTALQMGSGLVAQPLAGLAGIGAAAGKGLGLTDSDPADVVRGVQSGLTYQPSSDAGQKISNAVGYLPQKFAGMADAAGAKVSDLTGSPMAGAAVNTAIQGAPLLLGAKLAPFKAQAAAAMTPEVANATGLGLKLTPSQAQAGFGARAVESMSGAPKLERAISQQNTPVINSIAKNELGVPQSVDLSKTSIDQANQPAYGVIKAVKNTGQVTADGQYYKDVGAVQPPQAPGALPINGGIAAEQNKYMGFQSDDAANLVEHVRQLRADASDNMKAIMEPDKNALGRAQLQIANALENQLDRHIQGGAFLGPNGQVATNLVDQYRAARVQIAKSHTVLDSLDGRDLDIADLGKRMERGAYMSGPLQQLATAGQNFPRAVQVPSAIRNSGPFSGLGPYALAASVVHPAALGAVAAPPLARAALASARYQRYGIQGLRQAPSYPGLMGSRVGMPMVTTAQQGLLGNEQ